MDGLSLALIPVIRRLLQVLAWDFPASIVQYGTKDWYIMCAQYRTKLGNTEIRYLKSTVYVTNIYQYWIICNSMEWNCSSFVDWSNQPTCDFSRTMPSCVSMWRISRALFVTEPGFLVFVSFPSQLKHGWFCLEVLRCFTYLASPQSCGRAARRKRWAMKR